MSTIMRKPLIETIADSLDNDTLLKLNTDIDSDVGYSKYDLIERYLPILPEGSQSMTEKVTLVTNGKTLVGSYIKYDLSTEKHSYLLNYGKGFPKVYIYEIDEEKGTTYLVGECLGVSELRRVISERLQGGSGGGSGLKTLDINLLDYMANAEYNELVNNLAAQKDFSEYYSLNTNIDYAGYDRIRVNIPTLIVDFTLIFYKVSEGKLPMFMATIDWGRGDLPVVFLALYNTAAGVENELGYVSAIAKTQESSSVIIRRY